MTQVTDRKSQVTAIVYDGLNRPTTVTYADGGSVTYTYDAMGRQTSALDSINGLITRVYDDLDRLVSETSDRGTVSYTYDAAGRRTSMSVPGATSTTYSYDDADRVTQIAQGDKIVSFTYDAAGRATSQTLPNGVLASYTYDAANQLTAIQYTKGVLLIGDLTYAYDAAGRRIQMGGSLAKANLPADSSASYDAANRMTAFNTRSLSYDANGNLTNDGLRNYTWNSADQLTAIGGGANASFGYDAVGRRLSKTVNGTQTGYLYDGLNPVQELSGATPKANLITGGLDEFFSRTSNGTTSSFLTDALGSTLALTDANGNLTTQYSYEAYGKTTQSGTASDNPFQYTGRENDGTGLYYYRARYYDPELSRFISQDPIGFAGGLNLYAYPFDPISGSDPLGLSPTYKNGNSYSDTPPPGGACMQAVWMGGYIIAWVPCQTPKQPSPVSCQGGGPSSSGGSGGADPGVGTAGVFGPKDPLNNRGGPIDQSGRVPRTGNPISGPYDAPRTWKDWVTDKIGDSLGKWGTGIPGLASRNPWTIGIGLGLHSPNLGGCDAAGNNCQDMMPRR